MDWEAIYSQRLEKCVSRHIETISATTVLLSNYRANMATASIGFLFLVFLGPSLP